MIMEDGRRIEASFSMNKDYFPGIAIKKTISNQFMPGNNNFTTAIDKLKGEITPYDIKINDLMIKLPFQCCS